ncbi:hypothetical protein GGQ74_002970 [Desulfobaculum xiamenense]|uniref:DnaJ homologue subfamily C member 28 conserved domain-containing protein n=1 Tax=Desulfobaculum xiamenense TaxID=995050 RepID=A0A846QSC7_9BACT|nr:DUF1992 domain-containing protein [Desulfobaculum xiamenense]NJB69273.1 hypothetical protein [Desulfobaculum xiamenense]
MSLWNIMGDVVEQRIREAQERGDFDGLEGRGRRIEFEDDSMIPEDLRMAYKILRNSGHLPPEIVADREIQRTVDLLAQCSDEKTRCLQMQKLNVLLTKMSAARGRSIELDEAYYDEVVRRVNVGRAKPGRE